MGYIVTAVDLHQTGLVKACPVPVPTDPRAHIRKGCTANAKSFSESKFTETHEYVQSLHQAHWMAAGSIRPLPQLHLPGNKVWVPFRGGGASAAASQIHVHNYPQTCFEVYGNRDPPPPHNLFLRPPNGNPRKPVKYQQCGKIPELFRDTLAHFPEIIAAEN